VENRATSLESVADSRQWCLCARVQVSTRRQTNWSLHAPRRPDQFIGAGSRRL